jgi:hypothetical protein
VICQCLVRRTRSGLVAAGTGAVAAECIMGGLHALGTYLSCSRSWPFFVASRPSSRRFADRAFSLPPERNRLL